MEKIDDLKEIDFPLNLDGIYYQVKRGGRYVNRCFSDLTYTERVGFLSKYNDEGLRSMYFHLEKRIWEAFSCLETKDKKQFIVRYADYLLSTGATFGLKGVSIDD